MIMRLMRFRVLKRPLSLEGIYLPQGDYDGEIGWSELPFRGQQNRIRRSSTIIVTRAVVEATGQSMPKGVSSIDVDASTAVRRGDVVIL